MKVTLKWAGKSRDGKRAYVIAEENDGWKDLRIEIDTDDCDDEFALAAMQEVMDRCNASKEIRIRRFESFPPTATCPVCGTNDDKPSILVPISGTERESICEAQPTHLDCILEPMPKNLRYERARKMIYAIWEAK